MLLISCPSINLLSGKQWSKGYTKQYFSDCGPQRSPVAACCEKDKHPHVLKNEKPNKSERMLNNSTAYHNITIV